MNDTADSQNLNAKEFDTILNSLDTGIIGVNQGGYVIIFNSAAENLLGISVEEALGRLVKSIMPKSVTEAAAELCAEVSKRKLLMRKMEIPGDRESIKYIYTIKLAQGKEVPRHTAPPVDRERNRLNSSFLEPACEISMEGVIIFENEAWVKFNGGQTKGRSLDELREMTDMSKGSDLLAMRSGRLDIPARYHVGGLVVESIVPRWERPGKLWGFSVWVRPVEQINMLYQKLLQERLSRTAESVVSGDFIAESRPMHEVLQDIIRVAKVDVTVLITGETGVGKGILASKIHDLSMRRCFPFLKVNCGAIPETLLESELFGYEGGAFTGARNQGKQGLFEQANRGTIFLDEIGELPLSMQVKLLHALEDHRIMRVGGSRTVDLDIRVVCATNRDLKKLVSDGKFREDLYYRLNVVQIRVPPLRERQEDLPRLVDLFLKRFCAKYCRKVSVSPDAVRVFQGFNWPGNVRQLENVIEQMVVLNDAETTISADRLPPEVSGCGQADEDRVDVSEFPEPLHKTLEKVERQLIMKALAKTGSTRKAAELLGINQATVCRKAKQFGIFCEVAQSRWRKEGL